MAASHTIHIFDAIARDQRVVQDTPDGLEVEYIEEFEHQDGSPDFLLNRGLVIHLFGMNEKGESVRVEVNGFHPFFYVEMPPCSTTTQESQYKNKIADKVLANREISKLPSHYIKFEVVKKQKLIGYTGGKFFSFLKITVPSIGLFYKLRKIFLDDKQQPKFVLNANAKPLEVYESNIDASFLSSS